MSEIFDIDAATAEFQPVRIKFRGEVHTLGDSVFALLNASSIFTEDVIPDVPEGEDEEASKSFTIKVFEFLRPPLRARSPSMSKVMDEQDLTPPEEAALLKPVTEALNSLGRLSFRTEEEEREPDEGTDSAVSALLSTVQTEGSK